MNRFQQEYKWASFKVISNGSEVLTNLTYDELCEWLKLSKHRLFGHYIYRGNQSWDAEFFYRYETELSF